MPWTCRWSLFSSLCMIYLHKFVCLFVMYLTYSIVDDQGPLRAKLVTNHTYCSNVVILSVFTKDLPIFPRFSLYDFLSLLTNC